MNFGIFSPVQTGDSNSIGNISKYRKEHIELFIQNHFINKLHSHKNSVLRYTRSLDDCVNQGTAERVLEIS